MNRIIVKKEDLINTDRLNSLIGAITGDICVERKVHKNGFDSLYLEPGHIKLYLHARLTILEV